MIAKHVSKAAIFAARPLAVLAISAGLLTGMAQVPVLAKSKEAAPAAPKIQFSPAFAKVGAEIDKTLSAAKTNAAVTAATERARAAKTPAEKTAAVAAVDAALGGLKAKLDAAAAAVSTPGDKLKLGEMTRLYGVYTDDLGLQNQGLIAMLDSGVASPETTTLLQWLAGVTSYQMNNYPTAIKYLQPAFDAGYRDQQGMIADVLIDCYKRNKDSAGAMRVAMAVLASAKASGGVPGEQAIRTALQAAYDAKQIDSTTDLSADLVKYYPSAKTWNTALNVVRTTGRFAAQETLDIMRLMERTNSLNDGRDYIDYLQSADPRRFPGEAMRILNAGVAAGKLNPSDVFVAEVRNIASPRITADRASLPALERDANAPAASAALVSGAADAFMSYGEMAKAAALYKIASTKTGADLSVINTRLGIAQIDLGDFAGARATLAKVTGPRKYIAQMWATYAAQKAAPTAAASVK